MWKGSKEIYAERGQEGKKGRTRKGELGRVRIIEDREEMKTW